MFLSCRPFVATKVTSTPTIPVDNVVIATKGLQDRNINILAGTTVENEDKLILSIKYFKLWITLTHRSVLYKKGFIILQ